MKARIETVFASGDLYALLPAGALTLFWALSALFSGAYFPSAWYPAAIIVVIICPLLLAAGWKLPVGGARLSILLLTGFVAWTALSIIWADNGGHALEATNKLILALASAFVFALTPWNKRRALAIVGLLAVGVSAACLITFLEAAYGDPAPSFIQARWSAPMGYAGGAAAFAGLAVWPALAISMLRDAPRALRTVFFALVPLQVDFVLLSQSRGGIISLVVSAVFLLLVSPSRGWSLVRIIVAALIVLVTASPVLHVYTVANENGAIVPALHDAVRAVAIAVALGLVTGLGMALFEHRSPRLPGTTSIERARWPIVGAIAVVVVILAVAFGGRIGHEASTRWHSFEHGEVSSEQGSHLASFGDPERYDYWRVGIDEFSSSPIEGIGAGNFQDAFTLHRHTEKPSKFAHSIWVRVLSEGGIIGFLLLAGSLIVGLLAAVTRRSLLDHSERLLVAGAASLTVLVFTHASLDWVEEFPAVLGPGVCMLMLAACLANRPSHGPPRRQAAMLLVGVVLAGLALVSLVPAYLSLRFVDRAEGESVTNPEQAYNDLNRAAYLDQLSSRPYLVLGEIAVSRGEEVRAKRAFRRAIEREDNWFPHFELATIASQEGRRAEALVQMKAALRMNPVDTDLQEALAQLKHDEKLNAAESQRRMHAEVEEHFFNLKRRTRP